MDAPIAVATITACAVEPARWSRTSVHGWYAEGRLRAPFLVPAPARYRTPDREPEGAGEDRAHVSRDDHPSGHAHAPWRAMVPAVEAAAAGAGEADVPQPRATDALAVVQPQRRELLGIDPQGLAGLDLHSGWRAGETADVHRGGDTAREGDGRGQHPCPDHAREPVHRALHACRQGGRQWRRHTGGPSIGSRLWSRQAGPGMRRHGRSRAASAGCRSGHACRDGVGQTRSPRRRSRMPSSSSRLW